MATRVISEEPRKPQLVETPKETNWTKPQAIAIPKEGYFKIEPGRYGPIFPLTPACHGFTIIAKIKPGTEEEIREYGNKLEKTVAGNPHVLAPLQLHDDKDDPHDHVTPFPAYTLGLGAGLEVAIR